MKISICYEFVEGPWGGINQFLKSLKKEFINQGFFEEDIEKADILLFNGHPFGKQYFHIIDSFSRKRKSSSISAKQLLTS